MNPPIAYLEDTDHIVEGLLKTNEPPSDDIRPSLISKLETLQHAFGRIIGRPFAASLEGQEEALPEEAEAYRDSIQRYTSVLSNRRCLPIELWQSIFESGLGDGSSGDEHYLQSLCSVCRNWRIAAINHHPLWARLPPIESDGGTWTSDPSPTATEEVLTRRYLLRSGQAPLTVGFRVHVDTWDDPAAKERYQELLRLLTDQCYRWEVVDISLPINVFKEVLPCIQGNLPMLKKLEIGAFDDTSVCFSANGGGYHIDYFREAPLLREVGMSIPLPFVVGVTVDLPWSQLEKLKTSAGTATICNDLIQGRPTRLRSMDLYCYSSAPLLTKSLVTLPELETLRLNVDRDSLFITSLFDILTLPALSQLCVEGKFSVASANAICHQVSGLIQRSKCSLQRFHCLAPIDTSQDTFFTILRLSPNLQDLSVPHLSSAGLRRLVLNPALPNDPSNLVPNLKKMKLHHYGGVGSAHVDVVALAEVVISRTEGSYVSEESRSSFELLKEVMLENYDTESLKTQWKQAVSKSAGDSECVNEGANANSNIEDDLDDIATRMEDALIKKFIAYPFVHQLPDLGQYQERERANTSLHRVLDQEMRTMENLDLGKYQDVAILGRRNIPYLLRCVGQMPYELIPGDDVFKFRSRAKKLLDKWKPSILRDSLASPYIWRYGRGASTSRMFCHRSIDETANEENAEKIWKYLIGQYTP